MTTANATDATRVHVLKIDRRERDVIQDIVGLFSEGDGFGGIDQDKRRHLEALFTALDDLGWEVEDDRHEYQLRLTPCLLDFLRERRDETPDSIEYEKEALEKQRAGDPGWGVSGMTMEEAMQGTERYISKLEASLSVYTEVLERAERLQSDYWQDRCTGCGAHPVTLDGNRHCPACQQKMLEADMNRIEVAVEVVGSAVAAALPHVHPDDLRSELEDRIREHLGFANPAVSREVTVTKLRTLRESEAVR